MNPTWRVWLAPFSCSAQLAHRWCFHPLCRVFLELCRCAPHLRSQTRAYTCGFQHIFFGGILISRQQRTIYLSLVIKCLFVCDRECVALCAIVTVEMSVYTHLSFEGTWKKCLCRRLAELPHNFAHAVYAWYKYAGHTPAQSWLNSAV